MKHKVAQGVFCLTLLPYMALLRNTERVFEKHNPFIEEKKISFEVDSI